jgi:hypothetical protein
MNQMLRPDIEAAAHEILTHLESHGDAPLMAMKNALGRRDLYFYMGLGDLILKQRVSIQDREGVFWAIRVPPAAKAA